MLCMCMWNEGVHGEVRSFNDLRFDNSKFNGLKTKMMNQNVLSVCRFILSKCLKEETTNKL